MFCDIDLHLVNGKTEVNDITVKCTEFGEQVRNSTKRADALRQQQMQVYSYPLTKVIYLLSANCTPVGGSK